MRLELVFLLAAVVHVDAYPGQVIPAKVTDYLSSFGYLPANDPLTGNLRSESSVRAAIRRLQRFAGLAPTGRLDSATDHLMQRKRCGRPDVEYREDRRRTRFKRYVLQGATWPQTNLTYRVTSSARQLGVLETRRVVHSALQLWAAESALTFREMDEQSDADINIQFARGSHGDGFPFDGANVVLAHAFFPGSGLGGDAHFDADESWISEARDAHVAEVSLYSVAAHEFGHSLGLSHSSKQNSLMYPYYRMFKMGDRLPYDDILGIQKIYGVGDNGVPQPPTTTTTTPRPFTTLAVTQPRTYPPADQPPNECTAQIDAISTIRGLIFIFKDDYFWRLDSSLKLLEHPLKMRSFWRGLPKNITCDAIFELKELDQVFLFSGKKYWVFNANHMLPGYPQPLTNLGLPENVQRIDGAFVWDWSNKPYIMANSQFWRIDRHTMQVERGYPRHMSTWRGLPSTVHAAFSSPAGDLYFFVEEKVYKFNSKFMAVQKGYPVLVGDFWSHCRSESLPQAQQLIQLASNSLTAQTCIYIISVNILITGLLY